MPPADTWPGGARCTCCPSPVLVRQQAQLRAALPTGIPQTGLHPPCPWAGRQPANVPGLGRGATLPLRPGRCAPARRRGQPTAHHGGASGGRRERMVDSNTLSSHHPSPHAHAGRSGRHSRRRPLAGRQLGVAHPRTKTARGGSDTTSLPIHQHPHPHPRQHPRHRTAHSAPPPATLYPACRPGWAPLPPPNFRLQPPPLPQPRHRHGVPLPAHRRRRRHHRSGIRLCRCRRARNDGNADAHPSGDASAPHDGDGDARANADAHLVAPRPGRLEEHLSCVVRPLHGQRHDGWPLPHL